MLLSQAGLSERKRNKTKEWFVGDSDAVGKPRGAQAACGPVPLRSLQSGTVNV